MFTRKPRLQPGKFLNSGAKDFCNTLPRAVVAYFACEFVQKAPPAEFSRFDIDQGRLDRRSLRVAAVRAWPPRVR